MYADVTYYGGKSKAKMKSDINDPRLLSPLI